MHGKRLLSLANNNVTFSGFCEDLVKVLGETFQQIERYRSSAAKRERLWMAFHKLSAEKLPSMWKKLYTTLMHTDESEQLFDQTVNVVVYEQLLKQYIFLG